MKYRQGFVSNSSSSSFIIAINERKKCRECGRMSSSVLDIISSSLSDSESSVEWTDPSEYIATLQREIDDEQEHLEKWIAKKDSDIIPSKYGGGDYTVKQIREWANDTIKRCEKEIKQIKSAVDKGNVVVGISVDYHDELLNHIIAEQVKLGELEIIYENS